MKQEDLNTPKRVRIDSPSTLQPHHKLHGTVCIALNKTHKSGWVETRVYFTEGEIISMQMDSMYLVDIQNNYGDGK